ncbi:hypothetical protein CcaverHIS002_0602940 [Cutaneotrichosporon cavernicola]|uniref:F-box domain-containing protein n=1 Tax=Cutaneotrichosporon cavernicola TaxID=279322 RepID=A0AA48QXX2_9TREE|nr:uncharacterized protein CcaverHIS019_0602420 [Cutaneotrichosporon cavernicola]BEI86007.1 hypothetical protein CcaverHIS002_0602940 [Cutaneotrichosporon cavernicola]BEI93783.1 hypothetical protein CcaverHIS019_0602420 [Cutaneotrichosporon cavernicola]BEJ01561.1 hypothetical protein CcaverHIS631_0602430 [Cutaneotrichosporon cavernicola]BEJ09326.1 hypothetical protein CcaverHIS641_0602410 [Cutaneotrichosporon cavernicola]
MSPTISPSPPYFAFTPFGPMLVPIAIAVVVLMFVMRRRDTPSETGSTESTVSTVSTETDELRPCLILGLPSEILERVLANLDPDELVAASQTCSALRRVAKAPSLKYQSTLVARGYLDVPNRIPPQPWSREGAKLETSPYTGTTRAMIPSVSLPAFEKEPPGRRDTSALSAAEKAQLLAEREARFDELRPTEVRQFSVAGPAGVYELQDGIFLLCKERSTAHDIRPTKIRLIPLASAVDPDLDAPIVPCKEVDVGFPIADLTMDPSQDLIVVSEHSPLGENGRAPIHRFHLLSLSTGEPHPLAACPTLDSPPWVPADVRHVSQQLLQVMDSTLVVLIAVQDEVMAMRAAYHEEMFAWDWKTGVVLGRRNLGDTLTRSSMALLTPTTVAVTMPAVIGPTLREMFGGVPGFMDNQNPVFIHPPSIDIFSFAQNSNIPPPEDTRPLQRADSDRTTPRFALVVRLLMPALRAGSMMAQMHMRPDPAFPPVPSSQTTLGSRPFTQDPRRGVIVIEMTMDDDRLVMPMRMRPEFYEMFILRETLVAMADEGEARLHEIWDRKAAARAARGASSHSPPSTPGSRRRFRSTTPSTPSGPISRSGSPASPATPTSHSSTSSHAGSPALPADGKERTYSAKPRRKHHVDSPTRTFEWDEWGEHSTRVLDPKMLTRRLWVCSCSGYRYVSLIRRPVPNQRVATDLCVQDFNPHWWVDEHFKPSPQAGLVGAALETVPGKDARLGNAVPEARVRSFGRNMPTIVKSDAWDVEVVTHLPYRSVRRQLSGNPNGVMIDDQRIMLVSHQVQDHDWLGMIQHVQTWCM